MDVIVDDYLPPPEEPSARLMRWWHWQGRFHVWPKPQPTDRVFVVDGVLHVRRDQWYAMRASIDGAGTGEGT